MKLLKGLLTGCAVLAAATAIFGRDFVRSHMTTLGRDAKEATRNVGTPEYEARRIETLIEDMTRRLLTYRDRMAGLEQQARALGNEAKELEKRIQTNMDDLRMERDLLGTDATSYTIRGATYTRNQVETSAQARVNRITQDRQTLDGKRKAEQRLLVTLAEGRDSLRAAEIARDEQRQKLDEVKIALQSVIAQQEIDDMLAPLKEGALNLKDNELAMSQNALKQRLEAMERELEVSRTFTAEPSLIQHRESDRPGLNDQINALLGEGAANE